MTNSMATIAADWAFVLGRSQHKYHDWITNGMAEIRLSQAENKVVGHDSKAMCGDASLIHDVFLGRSSCLKCLDRDATTSIVYLYRAPLARFLCGDKPIQDVEGNFYLFQTAHEICSQLDG